MSKYLLSMVYLPSQGVFVSYSVLPNRYFILRQKFLDQMEEANKCCMRYEHHPKKRIRKKNQTRMNRIVAKARETAIELDEIERKAVKETEDNKHAGNTGI